MRLGLSVASVGYHYTAWRLPEVSAIGSMDLQHQEACRPKYLHPGARD